MKHPLTNYNMKLKLSMSLIINYNDLSRKWREVNELSFVAYLGVGGKTFFSSEVNT